MHTETHVLEDYKKIRNEVRRQTREVIRGEQLKIAMKSKINPEKCWNYINSKTKTKDDIGNLEITNDDGLLYPEVDRVDARRSIRD